MKFRFTIIAQVAIPVDDPKAWPAESELAGHVLRSKGIQGSWIEISDVEEANQKWDVLLGEHRFIQRRLQDRIEVLVVPMEGCEKKVENNVDLPPESGKLSGV
jgi:hypothetical protein